jgi:4-amino-4-deoxy-L-arabinose transferase-like glycosyltransferase
VNADRTAAARPSRILVLVVIGAAVVRLVLAGLVVVGDDEAYYWLWSRHLAWSYPDHPPMVALVLVQSTRWLGDGPFGIRAFTVLLASAMPWLIYLAARAIFDDRAGIRAGLFVSALPALGIGTVLASPDVPMAFFWAFALWLGWEAVRRGGLWWIAAGTAVGLALLSKLTALALALGLAGYTLQAGAERRRILRDPWLYAGALAAAALFAPVVVWNARHDWLLLDVTLHRERWHLPRAALLNVLAFAGGQVVYYGPLVILLVAAVWAAMRRAREPQWRYLVWMSAPVLAVMTVASADARTKPHWPAPAYLGAAIALAALWPQWAAVRGRWLRAGVGITAGITVAAAAALLVPWTREQVAVGIGEYDRLAGAVARQATADQDPAVVLTDRYQAASHIAYRLRERIPVTTFYGAFLVWQRPREWTGWRGIYAMDDPLAPGLDIRALCRNVRQVDMAELAPGRPAARPIRIFACDDLRFPAAPRHLPP